MTDGYLDFSSNGTDSIPKTARGRGRRTACRHARRKFLVWSVAINEGFPAGEAASALRALWLGFETCVSAAVSLQQLQQLVTFLRLHALGNFPCLWSLSLGPASSSDPTCWYVHCHPPPNQPLTWHRSSQLPPPVAHHHHHHDLHLRSATHGPYTKERADVVTCTLAGLSYGGTHVSVAIEVGCGLRVAGCGWWDGRWLIAEGWTCPQSFSQLSDHARCSMLSRRILSIVHPTSSTRNHDAYLNPRRNKGYAHNRTFRAIIRRATYIVQYSRPG